MSVQEEKLEKLVERIDELLVVLNRISEDLRTVSSAVKSMAVSQITQPQPQTAAPVSHEIHDFQKI
jgi:uncharacterized coiled-coil protein SlyX